MPSRAEVFFKSIVEAPDPVAVLNSFCVFPPYTHEEDFRDFKVEPATDEHLKRIISRNLSSMSNTAGGVLVFGIEAVEDLATKTSAAGAVKLIKNVSQFKTRLYQLIPDSTDPPVSGVQVEAIPVPGKEPAGFVVVYIPESSDRPVRAMRDGEQFFQRVVDTSKILNRSFMRAMFYPQVRSNLFIHTQYTRTDQGNDRSVGAFMFSVQNEGPATAEELGATLDASANEFKWLSALDKRTERMEVRSGKRAQAYGGLVHPGMKVQLFHGGMEDIHKFDQSKTLMFRLSVFARDREVWNRVIVITPDRLASSFDGYYPSQPPDPTWIVATSI